LKVGEKPEVARPWAIAGKERTMKFELTKYQNGRWACIRPDLRYTERDRWPAVRDQYAAHFAAFGFEPDDDALGFSRAGRDSHERGEAAFAALSVTRTKGN